MANMMALGLFVFGLETAPYQQFQRDISWRHPSNSRIGKRPARQYVGPGDESITLSGVLYPELTGGKVSIAMLRYMGNTGKAWPLLEGTGDYYGLFVIDNISENRTLFFQDGAARKIEFDIKLYRADDDLPDIVGTANGALLSML
jgi:phage protein U